jgi:hypothetical protein
MKRELVASRLTIGAPQVLILDAEEQKEGELYNPFQWLDLIYERVKPGDEFPNIVFAAANGNADMAIEKGASAFLPLVS